MPARKRKAAKKHRRVRSSCALCGRKHTKSSHRFHGRGSYRRTHSVKSRAKAARKKRRTPKRRYRSAW